MATYPNVNAANQYARDIVGGKILACQLTILACQRHLDDLERAKDPHWPYRFDKNKAERFLRFAQKMPHTSGEWARRKLRIEFEAWQKFALGVPFGWVHKKTGLRRFSEIYIEVPRKNGKSAIAAAVGNYMFCADGEHGAEVYCGATTEKQAWKVFSPALQMVKKLPALRQKFSIKPWAKKMTRPDGSVFAPVIGDPGDGDSPSCAIIDEYHEHTTDALYTTMTTGTDAKAAQDASDATASAVSGLTARVTDAEGKITAQAQQQTALATKVDNANSRVDNMAKTLSDSQSTQVSLNTSLQSQIDAQAAANIKNQTTLDNTIKSVASITSTQQTHATALEALATQQTTLTSSVGDLSASVQNTAKTVADVNGTVSSLWSMKVETVNGKNVGAGITLGSNGETSDMILYADRFSLFNRNNATAVPVMIAEGNELYIDTARIKNSSLTSTKIADGSITNAKIGKEIRSDDFVDGARGWSINKDGGAQFNNGIFRGHIEAASGKFKGTLEAQSFIGDIAVARRYDDMAFRRNQTVQRNGAYQNRGYGMTIVLSCTLVYQLTGAGNVQQSYSVDITFNIGGQEVTRRFFANAGGFQSGDFTQEFRFAADLLADNNNVSFFIKARGNDASIDYSCSIQNITATAFRTNSNSFS